ncbi:hypothetical protein C2G38_2318643 [Gigaspora rosea]|uniref:RNI-like protein n=1 Tax=Gigaspora rosea TaxID=44941 RepID=A0A397V112_9GLOM|nr:hypothetical protein C2G38_2318643 [Gigaspora rosea]
MSILCKNLTSLKLENFCYLDTCLDADIAEALLKNNTLTYLRIYFSRLNSKFWNVFTYYLCTNSSLKFLIFSDFNIGFEDGKKLANAICNNNTLASLCLCHNQFGSEGGKAFADALCKNATLTSLSLCGNQLGSEGGKAIADALCKNTTLTSLNLCDNQLGPEFGKTIADALCKNFMLNPPSKEWEIKIKCPGCSYFSLFFTCTVLWCYIGWSWEDIKWCKYCDEVGENNERYRYQTTHNSQDCYYKPSELSTTDEWRWTMTKIMSPKWKEKIKCPKCSVRCKVVYHAEGEQCPKTYPRCNSSWTNNFMEINFY